MPLIFSIKVVPSSGKSLCKLDKSGKIKCYLKKPPERGLANKELVKMLAKALNVTQNKIEIIAGMTKREKKVKIDLDISYNQLLSLLGIECQQKLF